MCPSGASSVPATLAINQIPAVSPLDEETIEFELDTAERSADYLLVIASLSNAVDVNAIRLESRSASQNGDAIPLNRTPGKPIRPRPSKSHRTRKSAWKFQDAATLTDVPTARRIFFLQLGSDPCTDSSYQPVETRLLARSAQVSIWQDVAYPHEKPALDVTWLADCLEQTVLPRIAGLYGEITDLDRNGTLSICLTRRLTELPATGVPVEGLVQFNDFQPGLDRPFGNRADVIFVSADLEPGPHATAILAHEAAHLAVFSRRREADLQHLQADEDWLNEGLAHYAEAVCGGDWSNLQPRIAAFQQRPALAALLVSDAAQQGLWRDPAARGAAWAFVSWLAQEYGEDILMRIASESGTGYDKIERITQQPFEELFRQWTTALWHSPAQRTADSNLHQGWNRSGKFSASALNSASADEEFSLRGSGQIGYKVAVDRGERCRLRITAPKHCRTQVTVVDVDHHPPRYWPVR